MLLSLERQINLVTLVVYMVISFGVYHIQMYNFSMNMSQEIFVDIQNVAQALGDNVEQVLQKNLNANVSVLAEKIFNSGDYQSIVIETIQGVVFLRHEKATNDSSAPQWFRTKLTERLPQTEAVVTDDWQYIGAVRITPNLDKLFDQQWYVLRTSFMLITGCILALIASVSLILLPLRHVIKQAREVLNRRFATLNYNFMTKEFKIIVDAINLMSQKLKSIFIEHTELNKVVRDLTYADIVTGLGNKRFFDLQLEQIVNSTSSKAGGIVLFLVISNLNEYRERWGYQNEDAMLRHITSILNNLSSHHAIPVLCRFKGGHFAMVLMNASDKELFGVCSTLMERVKEIQTIEGHSADIVCNIGATMFFDDCFVSDIINRVEKAVTVAKDTGAYSWHYEPIPKKHITLSIDDWGKFFVEKLESNDIILHYQPVYRYVRGQTELYHYDVLLRLIGPNRELLLAGLFMPILEQVGLGHNFDLLVIEHVLSRIEENSSQESCYSIKISGSTLRHRGFIEWLHDKITNSKVPNIGKYLSFEIRENVMAENPDAMRGLMAYLNTQNIKVGIDHFGCGPSALGQLDHMHIDYLKIDPSYTRSITKSADCQILIRSFVELAHGLDILAIATGVETEEEREKLINLRVDGMEGYFIGQPA